MTPMVQKWTKTCIANMEYTRQLYIIKKLLYKVLQYLPMLCHEIGYTLKYIQTVQTEGQRRLLQILGTQTMNFPSTKIPLTLTLKTMKIINLIKVRCCDCKSLPQLTAQIDTVTEWRDMGTIFFAPPLPPPPVKLLNHKESPLKRKKHQNYSL